VRRELVREVRQTHRLSERRACGLFGITRWINRYQSRRDPQTGLRMRLRELAGSRTRYGYRRLTVLLRREGWKVNAKRVYRLYRAEQLQVRTKKRAKRLADGRWFRILTVVDQYTRECLSAYADRSQTGVKVVEQMKRLVATRGAPESITTDNGGVLPAGPWKHGPIG
jgi:putative transposase